MPNNIIKSFIKKTGKSKKEIEKAWKDAEKEALKMGQEGNLAYTTAILKDMLGIEENISTYKRYSSEKEKYEEMLISSSIPQDLRPEQPPKIVKRSGQINHKFKNKNKDKEEKENN